MPLDAVCNIELCGCQALQTLNHLCLISVKVNKGGEAIKELQNEEVYSLTTDSLH